MSKKKKIILTIGISFIILAVSGFSFVVSTSACGFAPTHRGPGFFSAGFHKGRFHKRGIPPFIQQEIGKFILWRTDQASKNLNLTSTQQKEYDQLRAALQNALEKGIQTRLQIKELTHSQMEKEIPDILAITQTIQTNLNSVAEMFDNNLTLFNSFYASLDADQKKQIIRKIKEKHDYHKTNSPCDER